MKVMDKLTELSKEISYALRHAPWEYELEMDEEGWVPVEQLLDALHKEEKWRNISENDLVIMIQKSEKKRHEIFFLRQNRRVCDDCPIRNHEKCHVEHKGQRGIIDGIFDGEFFSFYFWIFDSAAGYADQSNDGNGKDCQKRCFAVQVVLHLNAYIRAYCHADGNGKCKSADAFRDFRRGQHITGQCNGGRTADRIYSTHIQTDHDKRAKNGERDETGKCQTK